MESNYLGQGPTKTGVYEDLDFIKKHLRYPLKRRLLMPLLVWSVPVAALCIYTALRVFSNAYTPGSSRFFIALLPLAISIPLLSGLFRYIKSFRFTQLRTGRSQADARRMLAAFFLEHGIQVVRHPVSPDIFQIVSTPVSAKTGDMREVMVLIADEGRILLNSHFANGGFILVPPALLRRNMEAKLKAWIKTPGPEAHLDKLPQ